MEGYVMLEPEGRKTTFKTQVFPKMKRLSVSISVFLLRCCEFGGLLN